MESVRLEVDRVENLLQSKGWSEVIFSRKLHIDYSYVYRIMRGQRGIGSKFMINFMRLCDKEGLNFRDYLIF